MKKFVSLFLIFSMILTIAACGNDASSVIDDSKDEKEYQEEGGTVDEEVVDAKSELARQNVYKATEIDLKGIDLTDCSFMKCGYTDNGAYYIVQDYKGYDPIYLYLELDKEGNVLQQTELDSPVDPDFKNISDILFKHKFNFEAINSPLYSGFTVTKDGKIEAFLTVLLGYSSGQEQFVPFEIVWDKDGSCVSIDLIPLVVGSDGYINKFFIDDDNNLIILYSDMASDGADPYCDNYGIVFDEKRKKGEPVSAYDVRNWYYGFVDMFSYDGKTFVVYNDYENNEESKYFIGELDPKTLEVNDQVEIEIDGIDTPNIEGISDKGELIFSNNLSLKKWSSSGKNGIFMDFVNSDILGSYVFDVVSIDGTDSFYGICFEDEILKIFKYDYREPDSLPVNKVITLGVNSFVGDIIEQINEFNLSDNGYRIVAVDINSYASLSPDGDVYEGLKKKIVSGEMPDILFLDDTCGLDFRFLAKEGHFADVGELIDKDPDLKMDDYCTNVFQAAKLGGRLYYVIPGFEIYTYYGSSEYVGEYDNWTVDEFIEYNEGLDKNSTMFDPYMNRETFLYQLMCASGYSWVDPDLKICDFNDPSFMKLVGFAKTLPEYTDYESARYNKYSEDPMAFGRDGLYRIHEIYGVDAEYLFTNGFYTFDAPMTITGFPSADRKGTTIILEKVAVLNNDSEDLDAAWSFAKMLLSENYQTKDDMGLYPVLKSSLYDRCMLGMHADDRVTKEDFEKLYEILTTCDRMYFSDYELTNLVSETVKDCMNRWMTPEQIATEVQKVVTDYLSEN